MRWTPARSANSSCDQTRSCRTCLTFRPMTWHYLIGEIVLDPREAAHVLAASTGPATAQTFSDDRLRYSEDRRGRTYWRAVRGVVEEI